MPYAYSATAQKRPASAPPPGEEPHRRRLTIAAAAVAVLAVGGSLGGILASLAGPSGIETSPAAQAVKQVLLEANVLEQNLGAPDPAQSADPVADGAFARRSDPLLPGGHELAVAERGWIAGGTAVPLEERVGGAVLAGERVDLDAVFAGSLLAEEKSLLDSLVAGESRRPPSPVSPGGASIVQWYSVQVTGMTARAEAVVKRWEQQDRVIGATGRERISATVESERIDALAALRRVGGSWRVTSLAEAPWQEPT